jgi:hypothetical protein
VDGLGTIYVVAMIALLATVGVAITWRHLAQSLRVLSTGVAVGVIGVLIALTIRLPTAFAAAQGVTSVPSEYFDRLDSSHKAGLYFGFLAVLLTLAAIWLAGPPVRRADAPTATTSTASGGAVTVQVGPSSLAPPGQPSVPAQSIQDTRVDAVRYEQGTVNGLTVSAAEPIDTTVHPGDSWPR